MSTAAKQKKLEPDGIPETASLSASRQLVEQAIDAHKLTGAERQILMAAWDHDKNWKSEHTLWFRYSEAVLEVLKKHGLMAGGRKP